MTRMFSDLKKSMFLRDKKADAIWWIFWIAGIVGDVAFSKETLPMWLLMLVATVVMFVLYRAIARRQTEGVPEAFEDEDDKRRFINNVSVGAALLVLAAMLLGAGIAILTIR